MQVWMSRTVARLRHTVKGSWREGGEGAACRGKMIDDMVRAKSVFTCGERRGDGQQESRSRRGDVGARSSGSGEREGAR